MSRQGRQPHVDADSTLTLTNMTVNQILMKRQSNKDRPTYVVSLYRKFLLGRRIIDVGVEIDDFPNPYVQRQSGMHASIAGLVSSASWGRVENQGWGQIRNCILICI